MDAKLPRKRGVQVKKIIFALSMSQFVTFDTVLLLDLVPFHDLDHFSAHFSVLEYRFIFTVVPVQWLKKCVPVPQKWSVHYGIPRPV